MELNANLRHAVRNSAQRIGFPEFWRWWTGELRSLVPAAPRHALQRRMLRPMVVFEPDSATLWEAQSSPSGVAYVQTTRIPLTGDPAQVMQAGRAALDSVGSRSGGRGARVVIALAPGQVLRKVLTYPAAAADNIQQVLGYDLDRHTPFKADELYYDAAVVGRDSEHNVVRVELAAGLRTIVDQLRRQVSSWGGAVVGIVPGLPGAAPGLGARRLNLLPEEERNERGRLRSWHFWVPAAVLLALVVAAVAYPLYEKRQRVRTLTEATEQARTHASASDGVRQQLEQAVADYNFVLTRKYAYPSVVALLDDVTHLLPDDTWITQLELKSTKGKDAHREMLLRGESNNAGRLVSLLEDSKLFEQAAPRSPTTKIQPGPGEIFDLGAQVATAPLPAPVRLADLGPVPAPPGTAGAAAPRAPGAAGAPAAASAGAATPAGTAAAPTVAAPGGPGKGAAAARHAGRGARRRSRCAAHGRRTRPPAHRPQRPAPAAPAPAATVPPRSPVTGPAAPASPPARASGQVQ